MFPSLSGALRTPVCLFLAAVALISPAEADTFEEYAALILGGLRDGVQHRVVPTLVLRRVRQQPPTFELDDPSVPGRVFTVAVVKVGTCRARMSAVIRDRDTKRQKTRGSLLFDFGKLTELEFILGYGEAGERIPSVRFAGTPGVCSNHGPGAACEMGVLRTGFLLPPEEMQAAVAEMSRRICPIPSDRSLLPFA